MDNILKLRLCIMLLKLSILSRCSPNSDYPERDSVRWLQCKKSVLLDAEMSFKVKDRQG